jgi:WXG100 family type VII secretion target
MPAPIRIPFGDIEQASSRTSQTSQELNTILNSLKAEVANLLNTWKGKTSSDYGTYQDQWNKAQSDLTTILSDVSTTLNKIAQNYRATEKGNQIWNV